MKILVSLSSYGNKNHHLLEKVINEYKSYKKYDITITHHGTVPLNRADIIQHIHPSNVETTSLYHREEFIEKRNDYDLFIFSEYDMLIKEDTVDSFIKYSNIMPIDYCMGLIRYELTPDGEKYLIDLWKNIYGYDYVKNYSLNINGYDYFTLTNVHQACYILTRYQLEKVISETTYNIISLSGHGVEMASSGIFKDWSIGPRGIINKALPLSKEDLNKCFIHHTADCHVNPPGVNSPPMEFRKNVITPEQLFKDLNLI